MTEKIQVAFVGAGLMAAIQLRQLLRLYRDVEVTAIADSNLQAAEALAAETGIPSVTDDYRDLINDSGVDVIHNCTPNHLHYPITLEALQAGKHVFSEKPLATDLDDGLELWEVASELNRELGVDFCYRYYPILQEAAARVRRGDVGDILMFTGHWLEDSLLYPTDYCWRLNSAYTGPSNALADLGSHWFDLIQWITGEKVVEIVADLHTVYDRRHPEGIDNPVVDLEDIGSIMLKLERGGRGTFVASKMAAGRKCAIDLQIYGSEQGLSWQHDNSPKLWVGHRDAPNEVIEESPHLQIPSTQGYALLPAGHPMGFHDALFNLFCEYYEAVKSNMMGDEHPFPRYPSAVDGCQQLALVDAAVDSARCKQWQTVSPVAITTNCV